MLHNIGKILNRV